MTTIDANSDRRIYRDKDHALLGGVCAGLAGYLGFNLKVTRILTFIAFLAASPIAIGAYIAAVFLVPSATGMNPEFDKHHSSCRYARQSRKSRKAKRSRHQEAEVETAPSSAELINTRCRAMDERLARLEKLVTSRRFQLEQELSRL